MSRATLNDLVEDFLRLQLGYGDKEIAVSSEAGVLYDPDETENLSKKLSDLGMKFPKLPLRISMLTFPRHQTRFLPDRHRRR